VRSTPARFERFSPALPHRVPLRQAQDRLRGAAASRRRPGVGAQHDM